MKHRAKNGDWSERKRIRNHPLIGVPLFSIYHGNIVITKVWNQVDWSHCVEPHQSAHQVVEFKTETGMRYICDYYDIEKRVTLRDGKSVKSLFDQYDWSES